MEYEATIGLEIHIQIKSQSKIFCSCANSYNQIPNSNTCPICLGHPGVLPVVNQHAINQMIVAGLMTNCSIAKFSKFDRKSYFYPDQPKNYQITQFDLPLCYEGKIPIFEGKGLSGNKLEAKEIGLERIHLEEDVGKSTHYSNYSVVDFNRAGIPLMETVSKAEITSADEAYAYMQSLQQIMQYARVSDCDQEKGQMRCDVNISVKPKGQQKLGTKVEIKNLNSNRHVHSSINYEIKRQIKVITEGGTIRQETRRWDIDKNKTIFMRTKETSDDYRYFPEPDLLPVILTDKQINDIKSSLPLTPKQMREQFCNKYALSAYDAQVLTIDRDSAILFQQAVSSNSSKAKAIANIMMNSLIKELNDKQLSLKDSKIQASHLVDIVNLLDKKVITNRIVQQIIPEIITTGKEVDVIVKEKGLVQVTDDNAILEFVQQAIDNNAKVVNEYKSGKSTALQFLVGQVMRFSKGKANPQLAIEKLKEKLDEK